MTLEEQQAGLHIANSLGVEDKGIEYPLIVIDAGNIKVAAGSGPMIKSLLQGAAQVGTRIPVYLSTPKGLVHKGSVRATNIDTLINIMGRENLTAYDDEGEVLEGNMVYTLKEVLI